MMCVVLHVQRHRTHSLMAKTIMLLTFLERGDFIVLVSCPLARCNANTSVKSQISLVPSLDMMIDRSSKASTSS